MFKQKKFNNKKLSDLNNSNNSDDLNPLTFKLKKKQPKSIKNI